MRGNDDEEESVPVVGSDGSQAANIRCLWQASAVSASLFLPMRHFPGAKYKCRFLRVFIPQCGRLMKAVCTYDHFIVLVLTGADVNIERVMMV